MHCSWLLSGGVLLFVCASISVFINGAGSDQTTLLFMMATLAVLLDEL